MDDLGLENAAILLMSLGEEEAAGVLKHLSPKEVQGLGETIQKMKSVTRERVDNVLEMFSHLATEQSNLVTDTDEYVKNVLRKALGEDKAKLLIDRIVQGGDTRFTRGGVGDGIAVLPEIGFHHRREPLVVLDHQDALGHAGILGRKRR